MIFSSYVVRLQQFHMDRNWMYNVKRSDDEFLNKMEGFIKCALNDQLTRREETIFCPCRRCQNRRRFRNIDQIRDHIIRYGYTQWIWHGESTLSTPSSSNHYIDEDDQEGTVNNEVNDETDEIDNVNEMFDDVQELLMEEPKLYEKILLDAEKPLYSGCAKFTILSAVLKLFNLKAKHGWSDISFTSLLGLLKDMLPEGNELPTSNYEAKKIMCPIGIGYKKIHACPNDCILYRNEYENLHECPKCGLSRYKSRGNIHNDPDKKWPPAKVLW